MSTRDCVRYQCGSGDAVTTLPVVRRIGRLKHIGHYCGPASRQRADAQFPEVENTFTVIPLFAPLVQGIYYCTCDGTDDEVRCESRHRSGVNAKNDALRPAPTGQPHVRLF